MPTYLAKTLPWRGMGAALTALALAACSTLPPPSGASRPARADLQQFDLEGRVSANDARQVVHASVIWHHEDLADDLTLVGPLGQTLAELSRRGKHVRLVANGGVRESQDMDALLRDALGLKVPVKALTNWVLGRPRTPGANVRRDAAGRAEIITEDGWNVIFVRYESDAADALPELIEARGGEVQVKLKIDRWTLQP
ncbi:MAG: outer membrane lipoprotein LolB [Rhodocyclaceae bacterium]|nr:outer membrane lipoprotein LolB [Rhodocyclaceae bacterium]